jgi:uncharacterized membrane protein
MVSHKRHIAKAISYRITGTIVTMLIGWIVTGSVALGAIIGGVEVVLKTYVYYLHERLWYKYINFGRIDERSNDSE